MKELTDTASITSFRQKFEAGRSFDLDDDLEFCPGFLTESDVSPNLNHASTDSGVRLHARIRVP